MANKPGEDGIIRSKTGFPKPASPEEIAAFHAEIEAQAASYPEGRDPHSIDPLYYKEGQTALDAWLS